MNQNPALNYHTAIDQGMSYFAYQELVFDLYNNEKNTGTNHSEEYLNYTNMNIRRMNRLDKKATLTPKTIQTIQSINKPITWLTLTEGWCADAAQSLPYIAKMANLNELIDFRMILRDENPTIMDAHLYNNTRSIPRLIILDTMTLNVFGEWGPRPLAAQHIVDQAKADKALSNDGAVKALIDYEKNKNLQFWYKKDKGITIQTELLSIIKDCSLSIQDQ